MGGDDLENNSIYNNSSFPGEKLFSGETPFFRGEAILKKSNKMSKNSIFLGQG